MINEQLAIRESPEMWCYLGDVTHEEQHYLKSWELSNCHYSRAQRNLAYLYLNKGEVSSYVYNFDYCLILMKNYFILYAFYSSVHDLIF